MMQITNLTRTKIDTKFLQKAAQAAFAVLCAKRESKNASPPQLRRGSRGGGVQEKNQHLTPALSSSEERRNTYFDLKSISLVFVGDAKMKELNKKYRGKNKTTDVLSFEELNEIFICLPQAKRQAKLLKIGLKSELTRLLTHGIVHLKGYDHAKSAQEAERMFRVEEKILKKL